MRKSHSIGSKHAGITSAMQMFAMQRFDMGAASSPQSNRVIPTFKRNKKGKWAPAKR